MIINHPIHPSEIESQLVKILDELQGTNKMRACLFNLVIYAKNNSRLNYLEEVAQKVIEKFPSRIIMIIHNDQKDKDYLNTAVSVLKAESGQNQIFCDYIVIEYSGQHEKRVPFVILPHILPDLPLYVLWGENPELKNPFWMQFESFVNRLIFDSESSDDLPSFSQTLLEDIEKCRCDIADLNWARTEGWRKLLTSHFHSAEKLHDIKQTTSITIHYNSSTSKSFCHTKIQALYLQSWIATQLNWQLESCEKKQDHLVFIYRRENRELPIYLYGKEAQSIKPGRILSIEIEAETEITHLFQRSIDHPSHIFIETSSPVCCEIPNQFILDAEESGQSLVKEIFQQGTNQHFLQVLQAIQQIHQKDICQ